MMRIFAFSVLALSVAACTTPTPAPPKSTTVPVFVGTYTEKLGHVDGKATGIYTGQLDTVTGAFQLVDSATNLANPSFVTLSPDRKWLFAVGENGGKPEQPFGQVAAYKVEANGHLTKINEVPSYGVAPCHINTDHSGKWLFVANYVTGNVVSYGIAADGRLSDSICTRQHPGKSPWAHQVYPDPVQHQILYAVDKGADGIFRYEILSDGRLKPLGKTATATGSGPRHLDFNPKDARLFACIRENNSTLALYRLDAAGVPVCVDSTSTLPADFTAQNTCADVHFHPNGRFVYGSNRGHNSIAVFEVANDRLVAKGHVPSGGTVPRNFLLTPDGQWTLASNQNSSTVQVYKVDAQTGMPTPVGGPVYVPTPVCLKMME